MGISLLPGGSLTEIIKQCDIKFLFLRYLQQFEGVVTL